MLRSQEASYDKVFSPLSACLHARWLAVVTARRGGAWRGVAGRGEAGRRVNGAYLITCITQSRRRARVSVRPLSPLTLLSPFLPLPDSLHPILSGRGCLSVCLSVCLSPSATRAIQSKQHARSLLLNARVTAMEECHHCHADRPLW